jgi:hypothetical protein
MSSTVSYRKAKSFIYNWLYLQFFAPLKDLKDDYNEVLTMPTGLPNHHLGLHRYMQFTMISVMGK